MEYNFDNIRPIYIQIVELIKLDIISGRLPKGEKILSVRDYALKFKVNPNTVQKALNQLEEEGLIYTERTNGKYVTNDEDLINRIKDEVIFDKIDSFISDLGKVGIDKEEIINYLKRR